MEQLRPWPFVYDADDMSRYIPDFSNDEYNDITAVLRSLARGGYPRLDAVPTALNAYNCNQTRGCHAESWAYFHEVTTITPLDEEMRVEPSIVLPPVIADDFNKDWREIKDRRNCGHEAPGWPIALASYRFLCFIHKHRIDRRGSSQKGVHTISIWDRELEEMTWHDTYHHERKTRRDEIRRFWTHAELPDFADIYENREAFLQRIRYRTVYNASQLLENVLREAVPPRNSLWAVMAIAIYHMNGMHDREVSIVPDRPEVFGGSKANLLPQFFAHLLRLCLEARPGPNWGCRASERFVAQLKILERLPWMRKGMRRRLGAKPDKGKGKEVGYAEGYSGDDYAAGPSGAANPYRRGIADDSDEDEDEDERDWNWVWDALKV
ncbi:hypothetical protein F5B20DRAFT_583469 [Whalleya microplaca]|nr:hypothetical protein F5B20DRAFT_583469 [Whalleya microplaca]